MTKYGIEDRITNLIDRYTDIYNDYLEDCKYSMSKPLDFWEWLNSYLRSDTDG